MMEPRCVARPDPFVMALLCPGPQSILRTKGGTPPVPLLRTTLWFLATSCGGAGFCKTGKVAPLCPTPPLSRCSRQPWNKRLVLGDFLWGLSPGKGAGLQASSPQMPLPIQQVVRPGRDAHTASGAPPPNPSVLKPLPLPYRQDTPTAPQSCLLSKAGP
jgi:hypothetical protein